MPHYVIVYGTGFANLVSGAEIIDEAGFSSIYMALSAFRILSQKQGVWSSNLHVARFSRIDSSLIVDLEEQNFNFGNLFSLLLKSFLWSSYVTFSQNELNGNISFNLLLPLRLSKDASLAQWLEHWSCKPGVQSSTL